MSTIKEIILENEKAFSCYVIGKNASERKLKPLSRVNLFVGANNSGKSRFMRELAKIEKLKLLPDVDFVNLSQLRDEFFNELSAIYKKYRVMEMSSGFPSLSSIKQYPCAVEGEEFFWIVREMINSMAQTKAEQVNFSFKGDNRHQREVHDEGKRLAVKLLPRFQDLLRNVPKKYEFKRVYLPTLRGLRRFEGTGGDIYSTRTQSDYGFGGADHARVEIFTGLTLYGDVQKLLLGTLEDREIISDFQAFLSSEFFHGHPVALIPRHNSADLYVKIGHEAEYPIHNLGDGIQSIIALTFPLFRARGQSLLVFIEEPEIFLHPGLQRLFLNVLMNTHGFSNFQYFIATHSNHFLDLTLDLDHIAVFTFRKELEDSEKKEKGARFLVENVSNENDQTLQLLGVKNSSVFFSNCTIWVEGITDRRYFSKYVSLYEDSLIEQATKDKTKLPQRFKQDLHYSFVEYSGGNITHWSFLDGQSDPIVVERVCAKLFLITDRDDAEAKRERHDRLREKLGDRYCCLPCREVENLLTAVVIAKVVQEYEGGDADLANVKQETYLDKPLGRFIETSLLKSDKKRRGSYSAESGTVSDKIGFCQRALRHLEKFSDLSPQAQDITKRIYEFIRKHNP